MKGQVWSEYLLLLGGFILVALAYFSYTYPPVKDAAVCTSLHMRALSEIIRQEMNTWGEYALKGVYCDLEGGSVVIYCRCGDRDAVKNVVEEELSRFNVSANVEVRS